MIIGFTGTRAGMTDAQRVAVRTVLESSKPKPTAFVHGDCVGADEEAHAIAIELGIPVYIRPCDFPNMRAHCEGAAQVFPETKALERNRTIVTLCDVLLAAPPTAEEQRRGGTWYTIRFARKVGKTVMIINPDGTQQDEKEKPR